MKTKVQIGQGFASDDRVPAESGKLLGLSCLATAERVRREFYLTSALTMGPLLWLVEFVFPSHSWLLLPHCLWLHACPLQGHWELACSPILCKGFFSKGPAIYSWTVSYHHVARAQGKGTVPQQ